jgi:hypothetical protein
MCGTAVGIAVGMVLYVENAVWYVLSVGIAVGMVLYVGVAALVLRCCVDGSRCVVEQQEGL